MELFSFIPSGLVGPLVKRFSEKPLAINSLLFQALAAVGIVSAPVLWMLYPMAVINSLGTGLIWPTLGALLANSVSHGEQGKVSGASTALGSLMSILGPLWAGASYDRITPAAPFWIGALIFVLAGLLLTRVKVTADEKTGVNVHSMAD